MLLVITAAAAHLLTRRPAIAGFEPEVDIAYRRAAMDRVLRVTAVAGFWSAAMVTNTLKNLAMVADGLPFGDVFAWQSAALGVAALVSIDVFRARLPKVSVPQRALPQNVQPS